MADRVVPEPADDKERIREAVCIHTRKIYAGCRDKDCIEDLRVYPTESSRPYIESAFSIRPRSAELLSARVNVEEITFNRGYYTVDVTYFYRVTGEVFPGLTRVSGLAVFDKRVILFGSEGSARVFTSDTPFTGRSVQPVGVAEAVDPIALGMRIADRCCNGGEEPVPEVPQPILSAFGEDLMLGDTAHIWYVTLGQFSLIRLERDSQLVIPIYSYGFPECECGAGGDDDPCSLFGRIRFPVDEFYPPDSLESSDSYRQFLQ